MNTYRLPSDGKTTHDLSEYVEAWESIARPLEQKFGWELMGYDPDFMFQHAVSKTFRLPVAVATQIAAAITEKP